MFIMVRFRVLDVIKDLDIGGWGGGGDFIIVVFVLVLFFSFFWENSR